MEPVKLWGSTDKLPHSPSLYFVISLSSLETNTLYFSPDTVERIEEMSCNSVTLSFLQTSWVNTKQQQLSHSCRLRSVASMTHRPRLLVIEAKTKTRREDRTARHIRIRKKVEGTPERPRLCVFRSNKHIYVQVIDDSKMHTLASASTMQKPISEESDYSSGPTIDVAKKVGEAIAKSCLEKGITKVAFDRGGYPYHGRIEALADAAREHGLQF
ncbi:50S ribosomal L18, chloroplastic [Olea europaea subsp. europaea]|uniref:Large ribosomal subunit protein uL18c n=1 Tax=Olea europaea subsp. europaea TaxID=158383 RepID=A0A8S0VEC6_OLEEU|nr:50S ribosomal L18, chloroplastic [Olea europaea subsp. europaea]